MVFAWKCQIFLWVLKISPTFFSIYYAVILIQPFLAVSQMWRVTGKSRCGRRRDNRRKYFSLCVTFWLEENLNKSEALTSSAACINSSGIRWRRRTASHQSWLEIRSEQQHSIDVLGVKLEGNDYEQNWRNSSKYVFFFVVTHFPLIGTHIDVCKSATLQAVGQEVT